MATVSTNQRKQLPSNEQITQEKQTYLQQRTKGRSPSLGGDAAYLHAVMPTSISSDSPHDNTHDEQPKTHVRGQYRENHANHDGSAAAQYDPASPCAEAESRRPRGVLTG